MEKYEAQMKISDIPKMKRIYMIMDYLGIKTERKFLKLINFEQQNFSNIKSGKRPMGIDLSFKILLNIPEISPRWLEYGEGEMLREGMAKDGGEADARTIEALHSDLEEFRAQAAAAREERRFFMQQISELKKTAAPQVCAASCAAAG